MTKNKLLEELDALLNKYGVKMMVELLHCEYPYDDVQAVIHFQSVEHGCIATYTTNNIYIPE